MTLRDLELPSAANSVRADPALFDGCGHSGLPPW